MKSVFNTNIFKNNHFVEYQRRLIKIGAVARELKRLLNQLIFLCRFLLIFSLLVVFSLLVLFYFFGSFYFFCFMILWIFSRIIRGRATRLMGIASIWIGGWIKIPSHHTNQTTLMMRGKISWRITFEKLRTSKLLNKKPWSYSNPCNKHMRRRWPTMC